MADNSEHTIGLYFIGLPEMKPIKNVTKSIVDKVELTRSNKMLAEDLKELQPVIKMLKSNSWSFDIDPDCAKRNAIMGILNDFDAP
jgi:hypothetical protein|tara:strand:- start:363 stop:620 length:258 start_codon:yes stop_codon:yes gene_type:complete